MRNDHAVLKVLLLLLALCVRPAGAGAGEGASPSRIVALGAPSVELTVALGLQRAIIARGAWDVWPPAIRALPVAGDPAEPNLELIVSLKPDLVVADVHYASLTRRLQAYGIDSVLISAFNIPEVIPAVRVLARALNRPERGLRLERDLQAMLDAVRDGLQDLAPDEAPLGLALTGSDALYSFSDKSGWRLLTLAGARNMCADLDQAFPLISREWLALSKPDFVLISANNLDFSEDAMQGALRAVWRARTETGPLSRLPCVRAGRLIVMDDLLTFGLRSIPGLLYLAKALHPDRFADLDPGAVHAAFLDEYFHMSPRASYMYP